MQIRIEAITETETHTHIFQLSSMQLEAIMRFTGKAHEDLTVSDIAGYAIQMIFEAMGMTN